MNRLRVLTIAFRRGKKRGGSVADKRYHYIQVGVSELRKGMTVQKRVGTYSMLDPDKLKIVKIDTVQRKRFTFELENGTRVLAEHNDDAQAIYYKEIECKCKCE